MKKIRLSLCMVFALLIISLQVIAADEQENPAPKAGEEKTESKTEKETAPEIKEKKKEAPKPTDQQMRDWFKTVNGDSLEEAKDAEISLVEAGEESVKFLLKSYRRYGKTHRVKAIQVLEQILSRRARMFIAQKSIGDKYREARIAAAKAVRSFDSDTIRREIILAAFEGGNKTRKKAARAICNIQDKEMVGLLIQNFPKYAGGTDVKFKQSSVAGVTAGVNRRSTSGGQTLDLPTGKPSTGKVENESDEDPAAIVAMVTGVDFGMDINQWKSWWTKNRDTFVFPNLED